MFETRSNVPIIEWDDPKIVLMPYLPNINAYDLFARNKKIKYFGLCPWAKDFDLEEKLKMGERIIIELWKIHQAGKTWGETILPNMIITADKHPVIVDPETQYDCGVPRIERRARDLRDILVSISGALRASEGITDYKPIVRRLLLAYPDREILKEIKKF